MHFFTSNSFPQFQPQPQQRRQSVVFNGSAVELPRNGSTEIKLVPKNGEMESKKVAVTSATMV